MKIKLMIAAFGMFVLTVMGQGFVSQGWYAQTAGTPLDSTHFTYVTNSADGYNAALSLSGTVQGFAGFANALYVETASGLADYSIDQTGGRVGFSQTATYFDVHARLFPTGNYYTGSGTVPYGSDYSSPQAAVTAYQTANPNAFGPWNNVTVPEPALAAMWLLYYRGNYNQLTTLRRVGGLLRSPLSWFPRSSIGCSTVKKLLQRRGSVGQRSVKLGMRSVKLHGHGGM
jgi:hypothetical protein